MTSSDFASARPRWAGSVSCAERIAAPLRDSCCVLSNMEQCTLDNEASCEIERASAAPRAQCSFPRVACTSPRGAVSRAAPLRSSVRAGNARCVNTEQLHARRLVRAQQLGRRSAHARPGRPGHVQPGSTTLHPCVLTACGVVRLDHMAPLSGQL